MTKPYYAVASAGYGATTGSRDQSIMRFNAPPPATRIHPTEKPQALLRYLIGKLDPKTVLDPFGGSCSTLLAAAELGVRAIGVEIDEGNCERAAKRLQQRSDRPFLPFGEGAS